MPRTLDDIMDDIMDERATLETLPSEKSGSPERGFRIARRLFEEQHQTRAGVFDMANVRQGVVRLDTFDLSPEDRADVEAYLRNAQQVLC